MLRRRRGRWEKKGKWSGYPGCRRGCSLGPALLAPWTRTSAETHPGTTNKQNCSVVRLFIKKTLLCKHPVRFNRLHINFKYSEQMFLGCFYNSTAPCPEEKQCLKWSTSTCDAVGTHCSYTWWNQTRLCPIKKALPVQGTNILYHNLTFVFTPKCNPEQINKISKATNTFVVSFLWRTRK